MNGVSGQPSPLTPPARHPLRPGTNSGSKTTNPASSLELASTSHPKDDRGQLPSYRNANLLAIPSFSTKDQGTQSSPASPPLAASGRHSLSAINLDPSQLPNGEAANPLQGLLDGRSPPQSPHSTPLKRSRVRPSPSFPERYRGSSDGETPGADRMSSETLPAPAQPESDPNPQQSAPLQSHADADADGPVRRYLLYDGPSGSPVPQLPPLPKVTLEVKPDGPLDNASSSDPRPKLPVSNIITQSYQESYVSARYPRGASLRDQSKGLDNLAGSLIPSTESIPRLETPGEVRGPTPGAAVDRSFSFSCPIANQYPNDTAEPASVNEVYPAHCVSPRHSVNTQRQGSPNIRGEQVVCLADDDLGLRASGSKAHAHDIGIHRHTRSLTAGAIATPQLPTETYASLHTENRAEASILAPQTFPPASQLETKNGSPQLMKAAPTGPSNPATGISSSFSDYAISSRSSPQNLPPKYIPRPSPGVKNYFTVEDRSGHGAGYNTTGHPMLTLQEESLVPLRVPHNRPSGGIYENFDKYLIPVGLEKIAGKGHDASPGQLTRDPAQILEHSGTNVQSSVANPAPAALPQGDSISNQPVSSQPNSNPHTSNESKEQVAKSFFSESSHGKLARGLKKRLSNFRTKLRPSPRVGQGSNEVYHGVPQPADESFFEKQLRELRPRASAWLTKARFRSRQPNLGQ